MPGDAVAPADAAAPPEEGQAAPEQPGSPPPFTTPLPAGVPPELATRIEELQPQPPMTVRSSEDVARWEVCARTAAAMAAHQSEADPELDDSELRAWAWHAARTFYASDAPTGDPSQMKVPAAA